MPVLDKLVLKVAIQQNNDFKIGAGNLYLTYKQMYNYILYVNDMQVLVQNFRCKPSPIALNGRILKTL